jgi:hypothetical protein
MCSQHCCANGRTAATLGAKCKNSRHARDAKRRKILAKTAEAFSLRPSQIAEADMANRHAEKHKIAAPGAKTRWAA